MPIDLIHISILQLIEQGKLSLDATITVFFWNVPDDKQSITVEHLRTDGKQISPGSFEFVFPRR